MPNLISQSITKDGINLIASNRRVFNLFKPDIFANIQQQPGPPAQQTLATEGWVAQNIMLSLGQEMIDATLIAFTCDPDGTPRKLTVDSPPDNGVQQGQGAL